MAMRSTVKRAGEELNSLRQYLKGDIIEEEGLQVLQLDSTMGSGTIKCISLDDGFIVLQLDIQLLHDLEVILNTDCKNRINFLYCLKGSCLHQFADDRIASRLEPLQTATIVNDNRFLSKFLVKSGEQLILNIIRINKAEYAERFVTSITGADNEATCVLNNFDKKKGYFHSGRINLEIGELIKSIQNTNYIDHFSFYMYFKGVCHLILAKQIMQFNFEMQHSKEQVTKLIQRELNQISETSDFIKEYPEVQHTINGLCEKSGLSAAKLQQGFHFLHNTTVGEFIRETRLKKAVKLLQTTDMNISEVVYSIGFTSRSYFCKIFKAKYSCNPKLYKQNLAQAIMVN